MGHSCKRFPPHPPAPYSPEIWRKLGLVGQLYRPDFGGEGEPDNFSDNELNLSDLKPLPCDRLGNGTQIFGPASRDQLPSSFAAVGT